MYVHRGETLIQAFLEVTLTERQAVLGADFINTAVGQQLAAIQRNQQMNRGFSGWFRDVTANLSVNLMTILVIGALVFGYKWIEDWSGRISQKAGVTSGSLKKMPDMLAAAIDARRIGRA